MTYKGFIVEDEPHQEESLRALLREVFPELTIAGVANSVPHAEKMIAEAAPDLVFLDVLLPPHTSFDLLNAYKEIPFDIIFTTSFEEYAVKAFRLSAVDYLLKPISRVDLEIAVERFKARRSSQESSLHLRTLVDNLRATKPDHVRIALPTLTGYLFVNVNEIVRCESDNTYTTFFTIDKKKIVVSRTLKECEQMLTDYRFFRVHNSHLVNLHYMVEYVKGEGGIIRMTDGAEVDVSRRRKEEFLKMLTRV